MSCCVCNSGSIAVTTAALVLIILQIMLQLQGSVVPVPAKQAIDVVDRVAGNMSTQLARPVVDKFHRFPQ